MLMMFIRVLSTDIIYCRIHLCGYDLNVTYPQHGHFPSLKDPRDIGFSAVSTQACSLSRSKTLLRNLVSTLNSESAVNTLHKRYLEDREDRRRIWKRDLSGRPNGTIDPFYGCFLTNEIGDYALNFSAPWSRAILPIYRPSWQY